MEQRRLRLGDIVDDYCPRERRITNHAIVAIVGDEVKQTRCATCESDHEFKSAKVPAPRKKPALSPLDSAIDEMTRSRVVAVGQETPADPPGASAAARAEAFADVVAASAAASVDTLDASPSLASSTEPTEPSDAQDDPDEPNGNVDEGPVHRRLIRASLPRPQGHVPERRPTDFTIRQPGGRNGDRFGRGEADGNRPGGGAQRFGGGRPGFGGGGGGQRFGGPRPQGSNGGPGGGQGHGGPRGQGGPRGGQGQGGGGEQGQPRQGRPGGGRRRRGGGAR